jgi:hypothetical protein
MTTDAAPAAQKPRLLVLVSRDHGELTNALSFAGAGGCDALLMLPPALYAQNAAELGTLVRGYDGLADILDAIEERRPDLVVLFSGYLLAINQLLPLPALAQLLQTLERRGIPVATSDPFMGLLTPGQPSPFAASHPLKDWLDGHFARVGRLLGALPHLYSGPPQRFPGTRKLAFFHPQVPGAGPVWLFVLAGEDYAIQAGRLGADGFHRLVGERIRDAARCGARAVLIAPQACVDGVRSTGAPAIGLACCGRALFSDLIVGAEQAFYWNMVSNSLLLRLAHALPIVFFDYGHLIGAAPPLFELGRAAFLNNGALAPIDARVPLDAAVLAAAATGAPERERAAATLHALPRPGAVIEALLAGACR